MNPLTKAACVLRYLGPRVVALRAGVYWDRLTGATRKAFAPRAWDSISLSEITRPGTPVDPVEYAAYKQAAPPPFLFLLGQPPLPPRTMREGGAARAPSLDERVRLLGEDRCIYFFRTPAPAPIDWYANPLRAARGDSERPWHDVPDFSPAQGDIRTLWEPARAAWALDLARAAARSDAPARVAELRVLFWRWVDSWSKACPPWQGSQWKCGQEASVRFVALAIGFWALAGRSPTSSARWRWPEFARIAWATGYRVAHHIRYAVSQKNNHALSEALGLMLIAQLFPEFRDAPEWGATGRRVMEQELGRQIYADGSYVQHSLNYERVMLNVATLALRLGELAGAPFARETYERLGRCAEFVHELSDPGSGRTPNYGNNDGAWVLPLSEIDFSDFRSAIQAAYYAAHRKPLLPAGPWDEDVLWLFGADALPAQRPPVPTPRSRAFDDGGYYTLRLGESWAMTRCHAYRDRPGQCDALHLDLWWRGRNILCDAGTYQYFTPANPALERFFKSTSAHNTVEIDQRDPVELVSRYLWLPWPQSRRTAFEPPGPTRDYGRFEGAHRGYARLPGACVHRRAIVALPADVWMIIDDVLGAGAHAATLRWHLPDLPHQFDAVAGRLTISAPEGDVFVAVRASVADATTELVRSRAEGQRVQALCAPYYSELQPALCLEVAARGALPARFTTLVMLGTEHPFEITPDAVEVALPERDWRIALHPSGGNEEIVAAIGAIPFRADE